MNKIVIALFFLLIGSLFVQIPLYESESGRNTLNLYHVLIALLFAFSFRIRSSFRVSAENLFFVVMVVTSLIGWAVFGFPTRGVLLPLILLAFVVGNRWQELTDPKQRLKTFQAIFIVVVSAVVIRNLMCFDSLGIIYSRTRSETPTFFLASGGRNLEATQLGLLSILLIGTVAYIPAIIIAAITSILMLARSGFVAVFVSLVLCLLHGRFGRTKFYFGSLLIAVTALFTFLHLEGSYRIGIFDRFDIATETALASEQQGRLAIWRNSLDVLLKNPLGHGTGNGFESVNEHMGGHLRENNAHNIVIEFALDGGVQSAMLFVFVIYSIVRYPRMIDCPSHRVALAYGILGLVEYTGYDAIGWFFIGVAHSARRNHEAQEKEVT